MCFFESGHVHGVARGEMLKGLAVLGSLVPGKLADLLVLDANPVEDIRNVATAHLVVTARSAAAGAVTLEQELSAFADGHREQTRQELAISNGAITAFQSRPLG